MSTRDSLPQRAVEMHRRTGKSIDDCLFELACNDAKERRRKGIVEPEEQEKLWTPPAPRGRLVGKERGSP